MPLNDSQLLLIALALGCCLLSFVLGWRWQRARIAQMKRRHRQELKAEQEKTDKSTDQLQAFLNAIQASPNGVIILDREHRIEWCNQTAARLLGLNATRDVAQHVVHLVRQPEFQAYIAGQDFSHGIQFDGKAVQLHPYGLPDKHGHARALLLVNDVAALSRAEMMRREFVANVSHEIRTPLTVMNGFIETMQSLALSPAEQARYLDIMAVQGQRLEALVADLLTLSKLDEQAKPAQEQVDMAALLANCEQEAQALARSLNRNLEIVFKLEASAKLTGSVRELHSAFSNLISNAVRYTPNGGVVAVTWKDNVLSVKDTGLGIAPEHIPRLTERFYRLDNSRARNDNGVTTAGGTGLGLAIVKHVAIRHGAVLEIESTLGQGSEFRIRF